MRLPSRTGTVIRVTWADPDTREHAPSDVLTYAAGKRSGIRAWEGLSGCWGARALAEEITGYTVLARPTLRARLRQAA